MSYAGFAHPAHLEPVTMRENIMRGLGIAAINARKTHCKRGHAFTPENTIRKKRGRACRQCKNEYAREVRRRAAA